MAEHSVSLTQHATQNGYLPGLNVLNTNENGCPVFVTSNNRTSLNRANYTDTSKTWLDTHLIKSDASVRTATLVHELTTPPLSAETPVQLRAQSGSTLPAPPEAAGRCVSLQCVTVFVQRFIL